MIRVRFAPSPTGFPHIGNIRTAIFDWLFARHEGGTFVLRIEDTDKARQVPGSLEEIMYVLRWMGMNWDEGPEVGGDYGPYFQSERLDIYHKYAKQLIDDGHAYYCYCTAERLDEMRKQQQAEGKPTGYDRHCRHLSAEEKAKLESEGAKRVVRFAMPESGTTTYYDFIRGELSFDNSLQDDFVMLKSDGFPTYNFASVIDDTLMKISHVIRGEEYISSMPKYVHLYAALGWEQPAWVHVPLILGPDRSKLSKRHGAVNFKSYIDDGYLPETMINYLALLGWSAAEDQDLYSIDELIERFTLEGIINHPAVFDSQKLLWMNGVYIRQADLDRLMELIIPYLQKANLVSENPTEVDKVYLRRVTALIQDRLKVLSEAPEWADFFLVKEPAYDPKAVDKWLKKPEAPELLRHVADRLENLGDWTIESIESTVREAGTEVGAEGGKVIHPVRVAATGRTVGPGLFEILEVLGKDRVVSRLRKAAEIS
jgi:glutamyl-tRNA synthetase